MSIIQLREKSEVPPHVKSLLSSPRKWTTLKRRVLYSPVSYTIPSVSFSQMLGIFFGSLYRLYTSEVVARKAWCPFWLPFHKAATAPQMTSLQLKKKKRGGKRKEKRGERNERMGSPGVLRRKTVLRNTE